MKNGGQPLQQISMPALLEPPKLILESSSSKSDDSYKGDEDSGEADNEDDDNHTVSGGKGETKEQTGNFLRGATPRQHRRCRGGVPENSVASLRRAINFPPH